MQAVLSLTPSEMGSSSGSSTWTSRFRLPLAQGHAAVTWRSQALNQIWLHTTDCLACLAAFLGLRAVSTGLQSASFPGRALFTGWPSKHGTPVSWLRPQEVGGTGCRVRGEYPSTPSLTQVGVASEPPRAQHRVGRLGTGGVSAGSASAARTPGFPPDTSVHCPCWRSQPLALGPFPS